MRFQIRMETVINFISETNNGGWAELQKSWRPFIIKRLAKKNTIVLRRGEGAENIGRYSLSFCLDTTASSAQVQKNVKIKWR